MNRIKKRSSEFTQVANSFLRDNRISFKAKGLFCYMFSMDSNWNFTLKGISKQQNEGIASISSAMNELKLYGFIVYTKHSDGTGTYYLDDKPNMENPDLEKPNMENPDLGNRHDIRILIDKNTNSKNTNLSEKNIKKEIKPIRKISSAKNKRKDELIKILKEKDLSKINKKSLYEWLEYKNFNYQKIGLQKILIFLSKFDLFTQSEIVDSSIMNGYQGLFEPKQKQHYQKTAQEKTADAVKNFFQKERDQKQNNIEIEDGEIYE